METSKENLYNDVGAKRVKIMLMSLLSFLAS